jgi:hypothetical protein
MPTSHFSTEDQWLNALSALISSMPSDPEPLARLLRSPAPIPPGIRDAIAELLSPGKPEYLHCRLVFESNDKALRDDIERKLPSIDKYGQLRGEGLSAEEAARSAGGKTTAGERTMFRRLKWNRDWLRLFGNGA